MLKTEGLPLSNRVLKEVHRVLLTGSRGEDREPGSFRQSQNWIGGTRPGTARFVPPPWTEVGPAMGMLEKFLHGQPNQTPILVKAALAHAQFETIHPFLDGNGRVGRLLIATTKAIVRLIENDRQRIQGLGRSANTASLVHDDLTKFIVGRPSEIAKTDPFA